MSRMKPILGPISLALLILLPGCAAETMLLATFNSDAVGGPPSTAQSTGTVAVDPGGGTVRVSGPPPGTTTNWVEISHPTAPSPQTALQGRFAQFKGDGTYGLLAALFIPKDCGVVTLQFEPFGQGPTTYTNFMHLDFMPNNTVRLDDSSTVFGTFPREQFFTVSVSLNISASGATSHMALFGTGASGSLDYTVTGPLVLARQFGGVRFWMGFQHTGKFKVDEILVTRNK
jgi:hypothetical protein